MPPEPTAEQKKANQRLGWFLGGIAIAIFLGFIAKSVFFGM